MGSSFSLLISRFSEAGSTYGMAKMITNPSHRKDTKQSTAQPQKMKLLATLAFATALVAPVASVSLDLHDLLDSVS